jgi:hypothetical protein
LKNTLLVNLETELESLPRQVLVTVVEVAQVVKVEVVVVEVV